MTTRTHTTALTLAGLAGLALGAGSATAATIYSETFSDGSVATPTALNGSTPDVTTGGATWTASGWQENGTTATIGGGGSPENNAFLALTPTSGNIYELSATITLPTGGTGWVALGFTADNNTGIDFWSGTNNAVPWMLWRDDPGGSSPGQVVTFQGAGVAGGASEGIFTGTQTFDIVLDTTGAQWTAEWFIGGSSVRSETYGTNPTINHVGFGRLNGTTSNIDDFTLTVVPEPSTAALLGLGGLALLFRRRK